MAMSDEKQPEEPVSEEYKRGWNDCVKFIRKHFRKMRCSTDMDLASRLICAAMSDEIDRAAHRTD